MRYGKRIRKLREEGGLKVYQLAELAGVHPVYITQIEKHGKLPSLSLVEKLDKLLFTEHEGRSIWLKEKYGKIYDLIKNEGGK